MKNIIQLNTSDFDKYEKEPIIKIYSNIEYKIDIEQSISEKFYLYYDNYDGAESLNFHDETIPVYVASLDDAIIEINKFINTSYLYQNKF